MPTSSDAPRSTSASATTTARPTSSPRISSTPAATRPGRSPRRSTIVFNWRVVSPRLGVNFKLNESGSTLLKAHYGRYYRGIVTGEFDNTTPSITPKYVFSGLYNAAGSPLDKELVSDTSQLSVDPNLKNPYTDQFILAFEQQAGPSVGLAVSYVYKRSEQQTAFPDIGGTYQLVPYTAPSGANVPQVYRLTSGADSRLFQLRNDDRMFARYHGVEFDIKKRMSNHWQANFGITLSKATGRQGGEFGAFHAALDRSSARRASSARTRTTTSTATAASLATGRWS